jgi:hypothetical protein
LIEGLNKPTQPDHEPEAVRGQIYKVSSLANGQVSVIFHVDPADTDKGLGFMHLRGKTVNLSLTLP